MFGRKSQILKCNSISVDNLFDYDQQFLLEQPITGTSNDSCETPDKWNGTCIALRECRPLYRLLRKNLPANLRTFLRNSQCGGGDSTNIRVCCPNTFTINDLPPKCGLEAADKIVGGEETSLGEFPWYEFNQSVVSSISFISKTFNLNYTMEIILYLMETSCFSLGNSTPLSNMMISYKQAGVTSL